METIDLNAEVQSALPAVLARMRTELADRIGREAQNVAMDEVRKATLEWATATLVPEIKAQLEAGREGYITMAQDTAKKLGEALSAKLVESAVENLSRSYTLQEVAKKIFGGY